jgi:hypothetical protein
MRVCFNGENICTSNIDLFSFGGWSSHVNLRCLVDRGIWHHTPFFYGTDSKTKVDMGNETHMIRHFAHGNHCCFPSALSCQSAVLPCRDFERKTRSLMVAFLRHGQTLRPRQNMSQTNTIRCIILEFAHGTIKYYGFKYIPFPHARAFPRCIWYFAFSAQYTRRNRSNATSASLVHSNVYPG